MVVTLEHSTVQALRDFFKPGKQGLSSAGHRWAAHVTSEMSSAQGCTRSGILKVTNIAIVSTEQDKDLLRQTFALALGTPWVRPVET